jgi:COP9 signalosome complex subunit 2
MRLWFTMCLRLGKQLVEKTDRVSTDRLDNMLSEMKQKCKVPGADKNDETAQAYDVQKGNLVLEALALEIQSYSKRKLTKKMRAVYSLSMSFTAVIEDPRVIGVIKESGGRMYMAEKNWDKALKDFYDAFLSLVECGAGNANHMLKYTVFSAMLANSEIDHLGTLEAKVYAHDPMIIAMSDLKKAAAANDIKELGRVMNDQTVNLLGDPIFAQY